MCRKEWSSCGRRCHWTCSSRCTRSTLLALGVARRRRCGRDVSPPSFWDRERPLSAFGMGERALLCLFACLMTCWSAAPSMGLMGHIPGSADPWGPLTSSWPPFGVSFGPAPEGWLGASPSLFQPPPRCRHWLGLCSLMKAHLGERKWKQSRRTEQWICQPWWCRGV